MERVSKVKLENVNQKLVFLSNCWLRSKLHRGENLQTPPKLRIREENIVVKIIKIISQRLL